MNINDSFNRTFRADAKEELDSFRDLDLNVNNSLRESLNRKRKFELYCIYKNFKE